MADPDTTKLKKNARTAEEICNLYNDAIICFLAPPAGQGKIAQVMINPAGLKSAYKDIANQQSPLKKTDELFEKQWTAAIQTGPGLWTVEVAVPFAALGAAPPKQGESWKANFIRRFREFQVPEMYWAEISNSWYNLEDFGKLEFQ
jgi:hypothetical protein